MGTIVDNVIGALRAADIRAGEAYPGGRIPALTGAVAAVQLGKVDRSVRTTQVIVTVMSPASAGGSACESTALRAMDALQEIGGTSVKQACKFDEGANVFYIEVLSDFFGSAGENSWSAGPGYTVTIGKQNLDCTVRFSVERSTDEEITAIASAPWHFTLEELLPPGTSEPPDPTEPFTLKITRPSGDETFEDCRWTSVRREETIRGISQIRKGTAARNDEIGIL